KKPAKSTIISSLREFLHSSPSPRRSPPKAASDRAEDIQHPHARQGGIHAAFAPARRDVRVRDNGLRLLPSRSCPHAHRVRYRTALAARIELSSEIRPERHGYRRQNHSS